MPGLILKLRPHEELMINGVVIQNGDRKARLRVVTEGAAILRLKDAMRPEEATTPARQAYLIAQKAVAGEIPEAQAGPLLAAAVAQLRQSHPSGPQARALAAAATELASGRYYGVMRRLGLLISRDGNDCEPAQPVIERRPCRPSRLNGG